MQNIQKYEKKIKNNNIQKGSRPSPKSAMKVVMNKVMR